MHMPTLPMPFRVDCKFMYVSFLHDVYNKLTHERVRISTENGQRETLWYSYAGWIAMYIFPGFALLPSSLCDGIDGGGMGGVHLHPLSPPPLDFCVGLVGAVHAFLHGHLFHLRLF